MGGEVVRVHLVFDMVLLFYPFILCISVLLFLSFLLFCVLDAPFSYNMDIV